MKFNLGDRVKDLITGYTGIISARTEWLNKCIRYAVQKEKLNKEGKVEEGIWFDEDQLKLFKASVIVVDKPRRTGGPQPTPQRAKDPS